MTNSNTCVPIFFIKRKFKEKLKRQICLFIILDINLYVLSLLFQKQVFFAQVNVILCFFVIYVFKIMIFYLIFKNSLKYLSNHDLYSDCLTDLSVLSDPIGNVWDFLVEIFVWKAKLNWLTSVFLYFWSNIFFNQATYFLNTKKTVKDNE